MMNTKLRSVALASMGLATIGAVSAIAITRSTVRDSAPVKTPAVSHLRADYDWDTSEANLRAIGAAMQLYRQHNGVLPVAQRRSDKDAGFARVVEVLPKVLAQQGKPWSIDSALLRVASPAVRWSIETSMDFGCVASRPLYESIEEPTLEEWKGVWSARGERTPILMDTHMFDWSNATPGSTSGPFLILRLDGTVERVVGDPFDRRDILLHK